MLSDITTVFSGNPLDRADHLRNDTSLMTEWSRRDDARFLIFAGDQMLSDKDGVCLWVTHKEIKPLNPGTMIFLGMEDESPRYALQLAQTTDHSENELPLQDPDRGIKYRDLRTCAMKLGLAHPTLAIAAQAKSMLAWHESHAFCAKCGAASDLARAGYERVCPSCGAQHFPRTDPVVIMLATSGEKALIGRNYQLPPQVYSALAGFMEPGETIEEAVARELYEEAGIRVQNIRYIASQPWPWPSSLMIGCMAEAIDTQLKIDKTELEDARWIIRNDAVVALQGQHNSVILPPPLAIARQLIETWVAIPNGNSG